MALSKTPDDEERELDHYLSAGDHTPQPEEYVAERDYFARYLSGKPTQDAGIEPELENLLTKLYDRQREDAHGLINYFMHSFNNSTIDPPDTLNAINQFRDQYSAFNEERERHIRQYNNAKTLLADMNEQSKQENLDIDKDQDRGISR